MVAAGISSRLFARIGTRPVIVAGALIAAAGVWYLSRIPVHGTYPRNLLPGLVIMAIGIGAVLVSVTTAANAGVSGDKAGLAAGLLNASQQLGLSCWQKRSPIPVAGATPLIPRMPPFCPRGGRVPRGRTSPCDCRAPHIGASTWADEISAQHTPLRY